MSNLRNNLMFEEFYMDKTLKYNYNGNKYSLFIGRLNLSMSEDDIIKKIESNGVTDIIDVKIQRNEQLESKRYAEVHLFSIKSVQRIRREYNRYKNVYSFTKKARRYLEKRYGNPNKMSKDVADYIYICN